jgi:hypothetical protein
MKKLLVLSTMSLLLAACSSGNSNSLDGSWEKVGDDAGCRESFTFSGENNFEVQNSRLQGGETLTGTYTNTEGNDYTFNYGQGTNNFTIEVNDNSMNVQLQGSDNVCEYTKVN